MCRGKRASRHCSALAGPWLQMQSMTSCSNSPKLPGRVLGALVMSPLFAVTVHPVTYKTNASQRTNERAPGFVVLDLARCGTSPRLESAGVSRCRPFGSGRRCTGRGEISLPCECLCTSHGAEGGNRTRTSLAGQGILSRSSALLVHFEILCSCLKEKEIRANNHPAVFVEFLVILKHSLPSLLPSDAPGALTRNYGERTHLRTTYRKRM